MSDVSQKDMGISEVEEAISKAYREIEALRSLLKQLGEETLRGVCATVVLFIPLLFAEIIYVLNFSVFRSDIISGAIYFLLASSLGVIMMFLYFYHSLTQVFREVMFIKSIVSFPDISLSYIKTLGHILNGRLVKLKGISDGTFSFLPIGAEDEVMYDSAEILYVFSKLKLIIFEREFSKFWGVRLKERAREHMIFPQGFFIKDPETGERIPIILPSNYNELNRWTVTFVPLKLENRALRITLFLEPMVEIISEIITKRTMGLADAREYLQEGKFYDKPITEPYWLKELVNSQEYLSENAKFLKRELTEPTGKDIVMDIYHEVLPANKEILIYGQLKRFKELELSEEEQERVKRFLGELEDDALVIVPKRGEPFLIFMGNLEDFLLKFSLKKGFSREETIFMGSLIALGVSFLMWFISIFFDPYGTYWLPCSLALIPVISLAFYLGNKAKLIRDSLMLEKFMTDRLRRAMGKKAR